MTDEAGHQLPNIIYPGLDRGELVEWVERFYGEYFFRPRVVWRIVRKAMFDGHERQRLYQGSARIHGAALQAEEVRGGEQRSRPSPRRPRPVPATRAAHAVPA